MKNKTKTYVLLIATLVVWGLIGYKIISAMDPKIPKIQSVKRVADFKPTTIVEGDTFSIENVERDPFLGTLQNKTKKSRTADQIRTIKDTLWPTIRFGGLIKKQGSLDPVFVLNINNQQYILKRGQTIEDVTLINGNAEEIVLRYNKQQKTFAIQ